MITHSSIFWKHFRAEIQFRNTDLQSTQNGLKAFIFSFYNCVNISSSGFKRGRKDKRTPKPLIVYLADREHGCVDPSPAAARRCPSPDASTVRPAFPYWGAPLLIPMDWKPSLVSEQSFLHHILWSTAYWSSIGKLTSWRLQNLYVKKIYICDLWKGIIFNPIFILGRWNDS